MTQNLKVGTVENRFRIELAKKETRDKRQYSYRDLAALTGISPSTITDWMHGHLKYISLSSLSAMCAFFQCTPADLLEYIPPNPAE
jgi:DNA-binding Xre family transcriptional regulator